MMVTICDNCGQEHLEDDDSIVYSKTLNKVFCDTHCLEEYIKDRCLTLEMVQKIIEEVGYP